jgi:uncharacterized protein
LLRMRGYGMRSRDYFPLGIATGSAFCNRKQETDLLAENIRNIKHTLLMATRRYGKSSLALHTLKLSGLPYVETDFYMATSEKTIESYILNSVVDLIGKTLGPVDKLITSIKRYVKNLKPKLDIGVSALKLELSVESESDPAANIKEGLLLLEQLLAEKQKYAVLLFDEFQHVGILAQGKGIEGAIRHAAQKTKYLTFIFSGSNRKLLKTMFEDETRPLYKLCWKLDVKRISVEHYQHHLLKAAKSAWDQALNNDVFHEIMELTEKHPYYVNKLCDKLWAYYIQKPPSVKEVENTWLEILKEEKSDAIKDSSLLSLGQKNVLSLLAKNSNLHLTSKKTILKLQMTSSSIITALEGLEEKDVIEKQETHYQIINPVVKYYVLTG